MKNYLYLLIPVLFGYTLRVQAQQCKTCTDDKRPQQPTSITLTSKGELLSSLPTAVTSGTTSSLTILVTDKLVSKITVLQKQMGLVKINTTLPCCFTGISTSNTSGLNSYTSSTVKPYSESITASLTTTYSIAIGTTQPQALTGTDHNQYTLPPLPRAGAVTLRLFKKDVDNLFLKDRFEEANKSTPYKGWNEYKPLFTTLYADYKRKADQVDSLITQTSLVTSFSCCGTVTSGLSVTQILCEKLDELDQHQVQLCTIVNAVVEQNKKWINAWLWYTGGQPLLNPFSRVSVAAEIVKNEQDLVAVDETMRLYHALSDKCCETAAMGDMLNKLKPAIATLSQQSVRLRQTKESLQNRQKQFTNWLNTTAQTETLLNEVVLYVSDCQQANWMRHYDASDDYAEMYPKTLLPDLVYERDAVRGLVHNIPKDIKVSAKEVVKEAKLRTELDAQLIPAFDALTEARSLSALIEQFTGKVAQVAHGVQPGTGAKKGVQPGTGAKKLASKPDCTESDFVKKLESYKRAKELINWLLNQTEPPVQELKAAYGAFDKADRQPVLRSEDVLINESQTAKGTNTISYSISEAGKAKPVAVGDYRTYNTVRFWPSVSINYVFGSRAVSIFDNATSSFRTDTDIDNFEAVVGVKYYWAASNMTRTAKRTKFIHDNLGETYNRERGNCGRGKAFATFGLGVSHKFLKNYFFGVGYDIVPGFSIQAGGNLFFRKAYNLNNGQIDREYDIPSVRGFFGLAIDPNVVTKLLTIF